MKLGSRNWISLVVIGFTGQMAWMLENMYLNVYLFNELGGNANHIAIMVALSAITATLTTIVMGAVSDKRGKRKSFIVSGYLIWGISVTVFSLITKENASKVAGPVKAASLAIGFMILWDCVMTFFGSTANDAAFNAWVMDITENDQRGRVESVLSVLPLIAMLIIFGALDPLTKSGKWSLFYLSIGILVLLGGIIGKFTLEESKAIPTSLTLRETLAYGFRKKTILENKNLYLSLLLLLIVSTSNQIWMPYLIIYIQKTLGIENYALILGVVLIAASVFTVISGRYIDKLGKINWIPYGLTILTIGLISMFFARNMVFIMIAGTVMMAGNLIMTAVSNGLIRDYTPEDMAGRFQGIRMIFGVMIPMILGPFIGSAVIANSGKTFEDLGSVVTIPTPAIFIAAIVIILFELIPWKLLKARAI